MDQEIMKPECDMNYCVYKPASLLQLPDERNDVEHESSIGYIKFFRDFLSQHMPVEEELLDKLPNKYHMNIMAAEKRCYSLSHCHNTHQHKDFIRVSELSLDHLPSGHRDHNLLEYIQSFIPFVVKIVVSAISQDRNDCEKYHLPGTESSHNMVRQATGWLGQVFEADVPNRNPCPLSNCPHRHKSHDVIGPIYVMTARHVVFDKTEALSTEVFFTDDTSTEESVTLWSVHGYDVDFPSDEGRDIVFIKCYSHDLDIFSHLRSITDSMLKATTILIQSDIEDTSEKPRVFVISHPHGRGKHVSFGTVTNREETDIETDEKTGEKVRGTLRYSYNVPTCPGSSGAAVSVMGTDGAYYYPFPHSEDLKNKCGANSGLVDWLEPDD